MLGLSRGGPRLAENSGPIPLKVFAVKNEMMVGFLMASFPANTAISIFIFFRVNAI